MNKKLVLSALLALAMNQQTFAMSLTEASQLALDNDANYAAQVARYEANTQNLPIAKSAKKIQASINGSVTQSFGPQMSGGVGERVSLDLSKTLYNGQMKYDIKKAEVMQDVYETELEIATENELAKVTAAYLQGLEKQEINELSKAEVTMLEKQAKNAKHNLDAGVSNKNQALDFKALLDSATSGLLSSEMEVNSAKIDLESIVGAPVNSLDTNLSLDSSIINHTTTAQLMDQARQNNKQLHRQQLMLAAADYNVTAKSKMNGPVVTGVASYGTSHGGMNGAGGAGGYVGIQVSIPLGGSKKHYTSQARSEQDAASSEVEAQEQKITSSVQRLASSLLLDQRIISAKRAAVKSATESLEATQTSFKTGQLNSVDVVAAQRNLGDAQRQLIQAKYAAAGRVVSLLQITGKLTVDNINKIDRLLK
ncbi:hypothetical protein CIK05_01100 [Bdellovibrio sp. qaytius]|nr:hypothetical protein CIK05_01100 [Bdellovibrio sp. qaytius]